MKKLLALILFVFLLSVCALGCSNGDVEIDDGTQNNGDVDTENVQLVDACSLLTKEEVETAIGMSVEEPEFSEQAAIGQKSCFYDGMEDSLSAGFVNLNILRAEEMPENIVESGQTVDSIYMSLKDNDLNMLEVEGIGDDAFWGTGGLYVLKGDVYFNISVGNSSVPENLEICKNLAKIVIDRI